MRLFPPGFTVVDRGSGSLTAQASLSIDRGSSRVSEFRRTRPTRLGRLSPRANGRFTSPVLSLISVYRVVNIDSPTCSLGAAAHIATLRRKLQRQLRFIFNAEVDFCFVFTFYLLMS